MCCRALARGSAWVDPATLIFIDRRLSASATFRQRARFEKERGIAGKCACAGIAIHRYLSLRGMRRERVLVY